MVRRNSYLEKNAVRHLNIQPNENLLEVGFGHGLGLKQASEKGTHIHSYLHTAKSCLSF